MNEQQRAVVQQLMDAARVAGITVQCAVVQQQVSAALAEGKALLEADPVQEPVAWMEHMPLEENVEKFVRMTSWKVVAQGWENPIPLYTTPPAQPTTKDSLTVDHGDELTIAYLDGVHTGKRLVNREWVGLTNDERFALEYTPQGVKRTPIEMSFAIEAKLREKNGGE